MIATCLWALSNKYLLRPSCRGVDDVEWGFAFDVHLNAFFPVLVILHFVQARTDSNRYQYDLTSSDSVSKKSSSPVVHDVWPPVQISSHPQLFFWHAVISGTGYGAAAFGNALWTASLGYYVYITFLGYSSLKILHKG